VKRSIVRQQETGSWERTPIPGGPRQIGREQEASRLARLQAAPDATVLEHCTGALHWSTALEHCTGALHWSTAPGGRSSRGNSSREATLWRAMRRLGWTQTTSHWQPCRAPRAGARRLAGSGRHA
jgi:hypothetical protein